MNNVWVEYSSGVFFVFLFFVAGHIDCVCGGNQLDSFGGDFVCKQWNSSRWVVLSLSCPSTILVTPDEVGLCFSLSSGNWRAQCKNVRCGFLKGTEKITHAYKKGESHSVHSVWSLKVATTTIFLFNSL